MKQNLNTQRMERIIQRIEDPEALNSNWDNLAEFYFQKKEFLIHLHQYNPCHQRYYELYLDDKLIVGTVVYTLTIDLFTFANIHSPIKINVIGLPVSVATPPIIGDATEYEYLLSELIRLEKGVIAGFNLMKDFLTCKTINLRMLPTIILNLKCNNIDEYEQSLRTPYRRRLHRIMEKFNEVRTETSDCSAFTQEHYALYLQIMSKTTTKLEILSYNAFRWLPLNFRMTTYYHNSQMLCWHIICNDNEQLFFFFGGMNYALRDQYQSYNNNLLGILNAAFELNYNTIDFGQTAEVAKSRLGGEKSERRMFIYHRNPLLLFIFKLCKNLINYSTITESHKVFKATKYTTTCQTSIYESPVCSPTTLA